MPDGSKPRYKVLRENMAAVNQLTTTHTPPLDADFLKVLRLRLPTVNKHLEKQGERATTLQQELIRRINLYDSALIMAVFSEAEGKFELYWQLGRLKDNIGQPEEALYYLKTALGCDENNKKVKGRIVSTLLHAYEISQDIRFLQEAESQLGALSKVESSDFIKRMQDRVSAHRQPAPFLRETVPA